MVLRRLTAYKLAVQSSKVLGAAGHLPLGPVDVGFLKRLRQAHPETDAVMGKQREACMTVRLGYG